MNLWTLKKEISIHVGVTILFFAPFMLMHTLWGYFLLLFLLGVLVGIFLPDIDHLIYTLFLKPNEITSQRVRAKIASKSFASAIELLYSTRDERRSLIFHNFYFQCLFVVFAFLVVTSSASFFGRGLVLSFLLSLVIDQVVDLYTTSSLSRWLRGLPMSLTSQQLKLYVLVQGLLVFVFGYLF
jgi:hypothetical protein